MRSWAIYRIRCKYIIDPYHPSALVKVNPKRESLSTDTLMPTIPSPCSVTTWPRITATRLLQITDISGSTEAGSFRRPINPRNADLKRSILTIYICLRSECNFARAEAKLAFAQFCKNRGFLFCRNIVRNQNIQPQIPLWIHEQRSFRFSSLEINASAILDLIIFVIM